MRRPLTYVAWALLLLALGTLVYTTWIVGFTLQHPSDGISVSLDAKGLRVNAAPPESGLQPGDIITHIAGQSVVGELQKLSARPRAAQVQTLLQPSASEEIYTVLRENQAMGVRVPNRVPDLLEVLSRLGILVLIGCIFVICAVFILLSRTKDPAAPLLALAFCLEGLNLVNNVWTNLGANVFIRATWLFMPIDLLTFALVMSLVLHIFLVFPERKWFVRRFPLAIGFVHGLNILIALGALLGIGSTSRLQAYNDLYRTLLYPLGAVELSLALIHLAHTYFTTHRPGVRNQIRWLMWGMMFGTLPWLLFYSLPVALSNTALLPFDVASLALALVPITFVFSVTRYGLMAVDMLIHRSLIYTGLSGLLVGVYLIAIGILNHALRIFFGTADTSRVATILAIILIALIANPLRIELQRVVDRTFYRRRRDLQRLVPEVGERLSTILHLDMLVTLLTEEMPERLQIKHAALLLHQEDDTLRTASTQAPALVEVLAESWNTATKADLDAPPALETPRTWRTELERGKTVVLSQCSEMAMPSPAIERLKAQWEVLLPLRSRGKVQGIYALGSRLRGDLYGREELSALSVLAHQIASTLENIQLYQQVELYTRDLESLVMARTHELRAANQDLGRERDRLTIILQQMADGLLVTDPDGAILMSNAVFQTMVQRPAETLAGKRLDDVPACGCLASLIERVQAEKASGEPHSADCEIHSRVLRASSAALSDGGGVVTVLRDITRERRIDQMKTEFISAVSHELRTPLTSVLGFARLISKVFAKDIVPLLPQTEASRSARGQRAAQRIHKNLDIIIIEAERLTRLINDVLDIAKLEAGDMEWHTREFALLPLIHRVIETAQAASEAKGLTLETHLPSTLPVIEADPERIGQVLENLLSNAIKFTDTGTITVTAQLFRTPLTLANLEPDNPLRHLTTQMAWTPPDDSVGGILISVADTGIGITEVELPYLFQRFYQVRGDTLIDKPKGTGLGLAISKGILMHYGGTIWANSTPGVGSIFSFVLPLTALPPSLEEDKLPITETWSTSGSPIPTSRVEPPAQGQGDLVLIVDDEPAIRTLLAQTLGDHGYRTLEVANGVAGLRTARRQRPSVIILDLMLPDLSGFDVAQLLKADPSTASIPIVILSILENRERAAELGIEAYLTKPVQSAVLLQTLAEVLESAKAKETALPHAQEDSGV